MTCSESVPRSSAWSPAKPPRTPYRSRPDTRSAPRKQTAFVNGVATRTPVPEAVTAMVAGAARFVRVTEAATEQAMRILWRTTHHMPEPAGAIALAGLLADTGRTPDTTVAVVMSGGNCDSELVRRVIAGS